MTDSLTASATVLSSNRHHFAFPYQGGARASITVRQEAARQPEVMLLVDRGQFACGQDHCSLKVRFDDGEVLAYTGSEPSDGSSDALFLGYEAEFMRLIVDAKRLRIEATFHREGSRVFEFAVAGLRWPPPAQK